MSFQEGQTTTTTTETTFTGEQPNTTPYLTVGDRVFKSPDDVVSKIQHADNHIQRLEEERQADQEALVKALEQIEALKTEASNSSKVDELLTKLNTGGTRTENLNVPSTKDLVQAVMNELKQGETKAKLQQNLNLSMQKAKEAYGDQMISKVKEQAENLGMTLAQVDEMASKAPEAFSRLFITQQAVPTRTGSVNLSGLGAVKDKQATPSFTKMKASERAAYIKSKLRELGIEE